MLSLLLSQQHASTCFLLHRHLLLPQKQDLRASQRYGRLTIQVLLLLFVLVLDGKGFTLPLACEQWGEKSAAYFVFPIAFAKVYGAWSICTSNDWERINELTTSRVKSSQSNGFVFAIGI